MSTQSIHLIGRVKYDVLYDILYVTLLPERRFYGDEYGHVTLMRDMATEEITGLVIYSPKRKQEEVINDLQRIKNETGFTFKMEHKNDGRGYVYSCCSEGKQHT